MPALLRPDTHERAATTHAATERGVSARCTSKPIADPCRALCVLASARLSRELDDADAQYGY
eukprot:6193485-Pleurochrysis_carterae.AAC.1